MQARAADIRVKGKWRANLADVAQIRHSAPKTTTAAESAAVASS